MELALQHALAAAKAEFRAADDELVKIEDAKAAAAVAAAFTVAIRSSDPRPILRKFGNMSPSRLSTTRWFWRKYALSEKKKKFKL